MSEDIILKAQNVSKQYRLGVVGTGTIAHDLNRMWHKIRGKQDPYLKIGAVNDRSATASSNYVWALQDINFEVKRGEILGIIGKNGAGKSTLLKILSRVTSPTTGSIKTKGRIASLLEVGTGMHPELTGRENIFLNGAILGMTKAEILNKIDEIVEFSGCQMYIDTPVKRYSSGMRVRLGFAVAAFLEPDILVVDEVLAVGDAEFQKKAIGKMQDISNTSGRTVLFVSHNMAAVQDLCSRVLLLEDGSIVYNGNVEDGIKRYLESNLSHQAKVNFDFDSLDETSIRSFCLKNESGEISSNFKSGELPVFSIKLFFKNRLNNPSFSIRISDAFGANIVTYRSLYFVNSPLSDVKTGEYELQIKPEKLYLLDGLYNVSISLLEGKVPLDIKKDFISFNVSSSKPSLDYITISRSLSSNCILFSNSEWNIQKL
ncbi:ABC transporter ATP-binding protein [Nonlabens ulvanivorans]|uniref:ABC transporter ATP-binding protein n=4 Tax=Nonlabens ulvanivorans TaxID=906888 RepID=UPI00326519D5